MGTIHKLTPAFATKLSGQSTDTYIEVSDTVIPGFKLRLYKTGNMSFSINYTTVEGRRLRFTIGKYPALSVTEARKIAEQIYAEVKLGNNPQQDKVDLRNKPTIPTLGSFLESHYLPWYQTQYKAPKARCTFNQFSFLYSKQLDTITAWQIEQWRAKRHKEGLSPATSNRYLSALKAMFNRAVEWDLIESNPLAKVKKYKTDNHAIIRYLTEDEEVRLRAAMTARNQRLADGNHFYNDKNHVPLKAILGGYSDHLQPMVLLLLNTGMRRGELFNLTWKDVDLTAKQITVVGNTSKSGHTRYIPLNHEAAHVLRTWKAQTQRDSGHVFVGKHGKKFVNISKSWSVLLKKADVQDFRLHDLRHHFASRLVTAGVDLNTVRELLGHSNIKMTLRYAHLSPAHLSDAVAVLNR